MNDESVKVPWFLYCLLCPIDKEVRYVGISTNPKRRLKEHITRKRNNHKASWIKKLKSVNLLPELMTVKVGLSESDAKKLEVAFGALFFLLNTKPLVNNMSALGGVPPSPRNRVVSEKTKEKLRKIRKAYYKNPDNRKKLTGENNPFFGKSHSAETKKKLSKINKERYARVDNPFYNKKHTAKTKQIMSQKAKDRFKGEAGYRLARAYQIKNMKPVKIWNEKNVYIFDSLSEAYRKLNLDSGALWRVLNKKQNTHKGFLGNYLTRAQYVKCL